MLLSSLTDVPAGRLAGALAADESRCCLREWLSRVPDPRSRLGRWHPLVFVLALAVCAFTAAGHDCPEAPAEVATALRNARCPVSMPTSPRNSDGPSWPRHLPPAGRNPR